MKALVTGGSGFVGSHLVDALLERGDEVTVLDWIKPRQHVRWVEPKITADNFVVDAAIGQDVIYHLAANADPHKSKDRPVLNIEENVMGTVEVLEAMRQTQVLHIVFASSSSVYGDCSVFPTPEDAPIPNQTSLYGASKMAAEGLISAYCRTFGMQYTILRFAPMLGEGYRRGHVWDFYDKLKRDPDIIEVMGDGLQQRCYVYVKDAMRAVLMAKPGETYNVGNDETAAVADSLDWICEVMNVNPVRVYKESWAGDKPLTLLDCSKIRRLGWWPTLTIKEAVQRTVRSFG